MPTSIEQEVIKKYALSNKQIQQIKDSIINVLSYGKNTSTSPLAIVVGGQQGAGKTALINYTTTMSSDRDFVVIDNDFFRGFHPQSEEIINNYPELYTQATDQIGMGLTSEILSYFLQRNYDMIIHQTLKNNRIADDAMTKLKDANYTVGVRTLAVPDFESRMSMIERCQGQIQTLGYCRFVGKAGHDVAYNGLPQTMQYIQDNHKSDFIEVFKRSEDVANPTLVYAQFNESSKTQTLKALENCQHVSHDNFDNGFDSALDAIEKTRQYERGKVSLSLHNRLEDAITSPYTNPQIQSQVRELANEVENFNTEMSTIYVDG